MKRVSIATLGCKVNQCESAAMAATLRDAGHMPVSPGERADCCIINTCTVTGRTDYQSRQVIRRAIKNNPGAHVIVTGCYAQVAPQEIARIPGVAVVAGNTAKDNILDTLSSARTGERQIIIEDVNQARICSSRPAPIPGRSRAFFKIQDGCDAFCTYCIVPQARGRSRSLPLEDVKKGIAAFGGAGYREVVLTGIHLGAYGADLRPVVRLADILIWAEENRPVDRIRLSSLEPDEITEELISLMGASKIICRHFHVPLQSADGGILKRMGRRYDNLFVGDLLEKIRERIPDAAIGLDVIVGFPGEEDEEFTNTLRFLEEAPAAYFHVFSYSKRPGTKAALMAGQVKEEEKKKRSLFMRTLDRRKREEFAARFVGEDLSVLIEEGGSYEGLSANGLSGNYISVQVEGDKTSLCGEILRVRAECTEGGRIIGRIIAHDR